jgi:hypothetical protein
MGLYQAYWIYKNWRYIKERYCLVSISPFWRGVFGVLFCHSLLRRIHGDKEANSIQAPSFSAGGLATGWVIFAIIANLIGRAPGIEISIISAFVPSFLFLVPVQNYVNSVNKKRNPAQPYHKWWSFGHIVCLAIPIFIFWGPILLAYLETV